MKWLDKYTGKLRGFRPFYVFYNISRKDALERNRELYRQYGINRSIYAGIESSDLPDTVEGDLPWLDRKEPADPALRKEFQSFNEEVQRSILEWPSKGYMILRSFLTSDTVDEINRDVDDLLARSRVDFNYTGRKIMQAYRHSRAIRQTIFQDRLLHILNFVLGREVAPFHTINFISGSEQKAHSDAVHMMTYPRGYLIAAWFALEDISRDQGALFFYPGSHRLPYLLNADYQPERKKWWNDQDIYPAYEKAIEKEIRDHSLEKEVFLARKGDVLIWHANLLHGGLPMQDPKATRRSMVAHYFAKDVICYHEISRRPAVFDPALL